MKECDKLPAGRRRVCDGSSGLPLEKVNQYREKWGIDPLEEIPKEHEEKSRGLGDTVHKIFKKTGVVSAVNRINKAMGKGCGCKKRQNSLNEIFPYKNKENSV